MTRIVLDTNVVLRLAEPAHVAHPLVASAIERLREQNMQALVFPQIIYEFWAVATRSVASNSLGMSASKAAPLIDEITRRIPVLRDERGVYERWRELTRSYNVTGVNSHETRIVAAMARHGISKLLTSNASDFARYAEVEVLTPEAVVSRS